SAAVVVVLPTPPLPDVTTITLAMLLSSYLSIEGGYRQDAVFQPSLDGTAADARVHVFSGPVVAVDREQFGFVLAAEDARARVAHGAGERAPAQGAIDMDRSAGDDFRAGGNRAEHGDIAVRKGHRLTGTNRGFEQERRGLGARRCTGARAAGEVARRVLDGR